MDDVIRVAVLGLIQGLTEFLPVSSSAHLAIAKEALGLKAPGLHVEIALHCGTLFSVLCFYRVRILELARGVLTGRRTAWITTGLLVLATIPAGLVFLLLKEPIDAFCGEQHMLAVKSAWLLLVTGVFVLSLRWARTGGRLIGTGSALAMGCAQAVAILPGISRSGATITIARHSGVAAGQAAEFSLLMSIPVIMAAAVVDLFKTAPQAASADLGSGALVIGMLVAAAVGFLAIRILVRLLNNGAIWFFGFYDLLAGAIALCLL